MRSNHITKDQVLPMLKGCLIKMAEEEDVEQNEMVHFIRHELNPKIVELCSKI